MAENANQQQKQQGPNPVWLVDFVKLDADIGEKKKVIILGPRHSDLTSILQLRLELFRARRDWVGLKYVGCTQNHQAEAGAFIEKHQALFRRSDVNQPMALFIDQGLTPSMEELRRLLDSETQLFFTFIFMAGNATDKHRELGELKDRGFEVVQVPCVREAEREDDPPQQIFTCVRKQQQEEPYSPRVEHNVREIAK